MKKLKYLLLLFFVMLVFSINSKGEITEGVYGEIPKTTITKEVTGIGICHGLELNDEGYCTLETPARFTSPKAIDNQYQRLFYLTPDGSSGIMKSSPVLKFQYFMLLDGVTGLNNNDELLSFCLDGNYPSPTEWESNIGWRTTDYWYARPINISEAGSKGNYDYALASLYTLLMNQVKGKSGEDVAKAIAEFFQIINYAVRVLNVRFGSHLPSFKNPPGVADGSSRSLEHIIDQLRNANAQLSNDSSLFTSNPTRLATDGAYANDFKLLQTWYCEALLAPDNKEHLSTAELSYCSEFLGSTSGTKPINFQPQISLKVSKEDDYSGSTFSKTVTVNISNLNVFKVNKYNLGRQPFFKLTGIKCDMDIFDCKIKDTNVINLEEDILEKSSGDSFEFEVEISGSTSQVMSSTEPKILLSYEYYHLLNSEVVTELRYTMSPEHHLQRMLLIEPFTQKRTEEIKVNFKSPCYTKVEGSNQTYWVGGQEVTLDDYVEKHHCCNLDPDLPAGSPARDNNKYQTYCQFEDEVSLVDKCDPNITRDVYEVGESCLMTRIAPRTERDMSHSYVHQYDLDDIFNAEDKGIRDNFETFDVNDVTYNNYWDLPFTEEEAGVSVPGNIYCRMFTSEDVDIYYPGVSVSANGSYFVFAPHVDGSYQQPMVEGDIQANYYVNVKRWYKDYSEKIKLEKDYYEKWQIAAAYKDAMRKLNEVSPGSCEVDFPSTCETGGITQTNYKEVNYTFRPDSGKFYNKYGQDLSSMISVTKTCGCGVNETPDPDKYGDAENYEHLYNKTYGERINLQELKLECEEGMEPDWEYYLAPDLRFYYSQDVADSFGKVNTSIEEVKMNISWESDGKYWTKVSEKPVPNDSEQTFQTEDEEDLKKYLQGKINELQADGPRTGSKIEEEKIRYGRKPGGAEWFMEEDFPYNIIVDDPYSFKQKLYYKPDIYRFTLTSSGQVAGKSSFSGRNLIDLGYVFTVTIETRAGSYNTWFEMENIGHRMRHFNHSRFTLAKPNAQRSIDEYLSENRERMRKASRLNFGSEPVFPHMCTLCVINPLVEVVCPTPECEDEPRLYYPYFFYRTISLNNVTPHSNERPTSNWETEKGKAAKALIETKNLEIYNDSAEAEENYLEYSFVLTPEIMMRNRENNRQDNYKAYSSFNLECKAGKECVSHFVTAAAQESEKYIPGAVDRLYETRESKWKYYISDQGGWQIGSIESMVNNGFFDEDGYPDELDSRFIGNWP